MTLVNIWRRQHDVLLLTDSAVTRPSGHVAGFVGKAVSLPHINTVIATRGNAVNSAHLLLNLTRADFLNYAEFERGLAAYLRRTLFFGWNPIAFELMIAHVSSKGQPTTWILSNRTQGSIPPWEPAAVDGLVNEGDAENFGEEARDFGDEFEADDVTGLKWLLEAQRRVVKPMAKRRPPVATIGGAVIATTISADGISQKEVGRWPNDRVGRQLDPAAPFVPAKSRKPKERNRPSSILSGGLPY